MESDILPAWVAHLEYCGHFGLDPDTTDPTVLSMTRFALWRKARAARQVFEQARQDDNWAGATPEARELRVWALKDD